MKYLKILILLITIIGCKGQYKNEKNMRTLNISGESEWFTDGEKLFELGNKTKGFGEKGSYESFNYIEKAGAKTIYMSGIKDNIITTVQFVNGSFYAMKKIYHSNKMIKEKGVFFNGNENTKLGIWYAFNESGKLIKQTNYDDGYDFSFEDVLNYCRQNKIEIESGDSRNFEGGFHSQILKEVKNNLKVWIINYQDPIKPAYGNITKGGKNYEYSIYEEIVLDGKTGKVLSKSTVDFGSKKSNETSFFTDPLEKDTYQKPKLGKPYAHGDKVPEGTFQIYEDRAYTKTEWEEFHKSLPWWKRLM